MLKDFVICTCIIYIAIIQYLHYSDMRSFMKSTLQNIDDIRTESITQNWNLEWIGLVIKEDMEKGKGE